MVSYRRLGDATKSLGQFATALAWFSKSMDIAKQLAADPREVRAQRDLCVAYERLGDASASAGKPQDALAYYRKYREIAERLAAADRNNAQAQRDLAVAYVHLGDESMKAGAVNDALEHYRRVLEIAQSLAADRDNALAQRDLWSAHTHLGHALSRHGDVRQAIAEFDAAQQVADTELAANRDFFDPYDRACYAGLKIIRFSLAHPQPDESQMKSRRELVETALSAVQSLLETPFRDLVQLRQEPDLSALAGVPQFEAMLEQKSLRR